MTYFANRHAMKPTINTKVLGTDFMQWAELGNVM